MKVRRNHQIHAILVKERHEGLSFFRKALFPVGTIFIGKAVLQGIFVHEHHFPFLLCFPKVLFQPYLFFFIQIRQPLFFFIQRCIQYGEMHIAPVEGIVMVFQILISIIRQIEMGEIALGHMVLPVQGVGFMVAQRRCHGDAGQKIPVAFKPGLPLVFIFSIVYQISQSNHESSILVVLSCLMYQILPVRIIGALGIGGHNGLEWASIIGMKGIPGAHLVFFPCSVFIIRPFFQPLQLCCIYSAV